MTELCSQQSNLCGSQKRLAILADTADQDRIKIYEFYLTLAQLALSRYFLNQRSDCKTHALIIIASTASRKWH
jgi:hypothetical protein